MLYRLLCCIGSMPMPVFRVLAMVCVPLFLLVDWKHNRVATTNFRLCYPNSTSSRRMLWLIANYYNTIWAIFGTIYNSVHENTATQPAVNIQGLAPIHRLIAAGETVVLIGYHHVWLETFLVALSAQVPLTVSYRKNRNTALERLCARRSRGATLVSSKEPRAMVRAIKKPCLFWHTVDQDIGAKSSYFVPFFGILAATHHSLPRLARIANAKLVHFSLHRDGNLLHAKLDAPFAPATDPRRVMADINQTIMEKIKPQPSQYLWTHKRFKTQPDTQLNPYK